ncbi:MAG: hypothetical protein KBT36_17185 [Kurthia sp.]|nr:hypothetical protein [Candidatus Kurthia equi]
MTINLTEPEKEEVRKMIDLLESKDSEAILLGIVYILDILKNKGVSLETYYVKWPKTGDIQNLKQYTSEAFVKRTSELMAEMQHSDLLKGFWIYIIAADFISETPSLIFYENYLRH